MADIREAAGTHEGGPFLRPGKIQHGCGEIAVGGAVAGHASAHQRHHPRKIPFVEFAHGFEAGHAEFEHHEASARAESLAEEKAGADPTPEQVGIEQECKTLYRKLMKELHPDLHPDQDAAAQMLFKKAVAAYKASDLKTLQERNLEKIGLQKPLLIRE